ncbi:uncharacterized protein N7511_002575 [Penicillium nucicola]|uniref:uncharacterized protein n=1 Tax=Penicillium nucicola TaxID=1850975 RepID=UPI0025451988|nr:uncharacterized protein N7511_002575 [Penicillium nucicola]KAJ5770524.1 hypothetical protein N7511_002575 [Penicillium nucicola]
MEIKSDSPGMDIEKAGFNQPTELDISKAEMFETNIQFVEQAGTQRNIKSRHAQMIAIGSAIGTGFFLGTGQALSIGGPGFLLVAYCLTSILVYGVTTAMIEMSTYLPVSGASMSYFGGRYVSPSLGFAMGWLYFYSFAIIVAFELTAASILINYWPNDVHIAVWITVLLVVVVGLNFFPVGVFAETEFWFAGIKVVVIIGLLILSLVIMLGGGPNHDRLGFRYWNEPGAVKTYLLDGTSGRFTAFLYVWVFSGFSFYFGPELMVYTSGEMRNPHKNLASASRRYFYRLVFFYVLGSLAIGVTCRSDAQGLTSGTSNANSSPWVIAIRNAGIPALPSIINAGLLTSAWSAGNSYLFMSSRALYSLALAGNAPKIFARCNRYGLPVYAVIASSCFAPLAYLDCSSQAGVAFNWFVSLTNTSGYISWTLCCLVYFRFRKAAELQGVTAPYSSRFQPWAARICFVAFVCLLLCNGFTVFYPGQFTASGFLTTYLGIPLFLAIYFGHKVTAGRNDPWMTGSAEVDLITGVAEVTADAEMWTRLEQAEKENQIAKSKVWKTVSSIWE